MKKEEIHLGDLHRWLFGLTPPEFMLEVVIRTLLIYVVLILVVRLLGKRMAGQITVVELSVMITLGAIVSPVMQLPDRGVLFGVVALSVALVFQRGLNLLTFYNEKVEELTVGKISLLIKDGALQLDELDKARITKEQLFAMLREEKIQNLGKISRVYLEACGNLSVYEVDETAGLALTPSFDPDLSMFQEPSPEHVMACLNCGHVQVTHARLDECEVCQSHEWTKAYLQTNS